MLRCDPTIFWDVFRCIHGVEQSQCFALRVKNNVGDTQEFWACGFAVTQEKEQMQQELVDKSFQQLQCNNC